MKISSRHLLGVDALGALVSTALFFFMLIPFQMYIGMSINHLQILGGGAVILAIVSGLSYWLITEKTAMALHLIAALNTIYILVTASFIYQDWLQMTKIGLAYFLLEASLVTLLVYLEYKTGKKEAARQH